MTKQIILVFFILLLTPSIFAQQGLIKGTLTEEYNGTMQSLPFANVFLEGTTIGTTTDFDGNFQFSAPSGNGVLVCSFMGYETVKKEVEIPANGELSVQVQMKTEGVAIEGIEVVAKVNRESEMALVMEQKNASMAIEAIGARQLSAQGVSDASEGVTKVTGITKQSGSYTLNVRGLGDRYNSTTLNGLPLPSNHAEYKNMNLELLPTDVIGYIGVEKAFSSKLYGDVAGANVNIVSKRHSGDAYLKVDIKTGQNTNLGKTDQFYLQDGPGKLGLNYFNRPNGEYVPDNYSVFENKWNSIAANTYPNFGLGLSGGKTFKLNNGAKLNLYATGGFDNKYAYNYLVENRVNGSGFYRQELAGDHFTYATQTSSMINLNYSTTGTEIYFNSMVLHSSEQEMKQMEGFYIDIVGDRNLETAYLRRSNFTRNLVLVNQMLGEHTLTERMDLNWGVAYNKVINTLPDRRSNIFVKNNQSGVYVPSTNDRANNHRYWHDLDENELAANLSVNYKFGSSMGSSSQSKGLFTLGYNGRVKLRDFESIQYNHQINRDKYDDPIDIWNVDAYFNDEKMQAGDFSLKTFYGNLNLPVTYSGTQFINAGFAAVEYNFSDRLLALVGLRAEAIIQDIDYKTTISSGSNGFDKFYLLPSLSLRYKTTEKANIRFAASQTYTLPQFKESAPFQFEGITYSTIGNPYLYPSTDYNGDLKWEYFPKSGELLSVTGFGKYIQNPINHFVMSSASNDFTYANTGDWAYVLGAELELRKDLLSKPISGGTQKLSLIANLSLMHTKQELNNEKVSEESEGKYISSFNTDREVLQGAAPIIGNLGLSYGINKNEGKQAHSISLISEYVSDRMYLLGYAGAIGNQVDKAYTRLDLIVKSRFDRFEISAGAKNILNADIKRVQENSDKDYTVMLYKQGVELKLGISYKF